MSDKSSAKSYAVVETGGKQYLVHEGDKVRVELLDAKVGAKVSLSTVLAVSDGKELKVGTPNVKGAKVSAKVMDHVKAKKVVAFKKKRRKGHRKKQGHRQNLTVIEIESIK